MFKLLSKKTIKSLRKKTLLLSAISFFALSTTASATVVIIETSQGSIEVNLFDETTPVTVENFLTYVNNGDFNNTVFHRSIPNFVVQGGGFTFEGGGNLTPITTRAAIKNEPVWSNRRGTVAMAKLGSSVNSATSQWFFNLTDNHLGGNGLDIQNGGFTAFGKVTDEGMVVVDKIAAIDLCNDIPMPNFDCAATSTPGTENFVTIISVTIKDATVDTASSLTLVKNTLIDEQNTADNSSSGGGAIAWLSLLSLALIGFGRRKFNA